MREWTESGQEKSLSLLVLRFAASFCEEGWGREVKAAEKLISSPFFRDEYSSLQAFERFPFRLGRACVSLSKWGQGRTVEIHFEVNACKSLRLFRVWLLLLLFSQEMLSFLYVKKPLASHKKSWRDEDAGKGWWEKLSKTNLIYYNPYHGNRWRPVSQSGLAVVVPFTASERTGKVVHIPIWMVLAMTIPVQPTKRQSGRQSQQKKRLNKSSF